MKEMNGFYFIIAPDGSRYLFQGEDNARRAFEIIGGEVREARISCNGQVLPSGLTYYFS